MESLLDSSSCLSLALRFAFLPFVLARRALASESCWGTGERGNGREEEEIEDERVRITNIYQ
jgi:hypothetical protein